MLGMRGNFRRLAWLAVVLLLACILLPAAFGLFANPAAVSPELAWALAREAWARGQAYKAHRMTSRFDELNGKGEVSSSTYTEYALRWNGDRSEATIIRATKDGKDITEKAREEERKRKKPDATSAASGSSGGMDAGDFVPFSEKAAPKLSRGVARWSGADFSVPYRIKDPKSGSIGEVRFGPSGMPLSLSYSLEKMPSMVGEFLGTATFSTLPDGALVISRYGFSGEGGFLFIRMRFNVVMDFSDYRLP